MERAEDSIKNKGGQGNKQCKN